MLSEHCYTPYKVLFFSFPSDLMKSSVVDKSLFSTQQLFYSREDQLATICMFCLIKVIGVVCHVSKVLSMYDISYLEDIFCFCTIV